MSYLRCVVLILASILAILAAPEDAVACLHPSRADAEQARVRVREQQAVLIRLPGSKQRLVTQPSFASPKSLDSLAWLLPVPSTPTSYSTASTKLFEDMSKFVRLRREKIFARGLKGAKSKRPNTKGVGIELLPPARAGGYHIQPIAIEGEAGVDALEQWLKENSFASPRRDVLEYYGERSWTFLAIKVDAHDEGLTGGALAPLVIDYRYESAVFPLKIMAGQGVFPVRLYVIGAKPLTIAELEAASRAGFEAASGFGVPYVPSVKRQHRADKLAQELSMFTPEQAPSSVRDIFSGTAVGSKDSLRVRVLYQKRFDAGVAALGELPEDLSVPLLTGPLQGEIDRSIAPIDKVSVEEQHEAKPTASKTSPVTAPTKLPDPPEEVAARPPAPSAVSGSEEGPPWWLLGVLGAVIALVAVVSVAKKKSVDI